MTSSFEYTRELLASAVRTRTVPDLYRAMCEGKKGFTSSAHAVGALLALSRKDRRNRDDRKLDVYHCPFCGLLHVGHEAVVNNNQE